MALIKTVKGIKPIIGKDCFLADNATTDRGGGDGRSLQCLV